MSDPRALEQYHQTRIETGSPAHLVVMLYEGAIRFAREAASAIDAGDIPRKANAINRSMRIVQELSNALDHEAGGPISERLAALYQYLEYELLQATTFNETRHLENAVRVLERLLESWRTVAETSDSVPAVSPTPSAPSSATPGPASEDSGSLVPAGLSISA